MTYIPIKSFSSNKFPVAIIDVPWLHYGDPFKDQAAGKHYDCIADEEVFKLPVADVLLPRSILFVWATSPRLDMAIDSIRAWGLHYRGIAFDWIKTNKAGKPINGQGVKASLIKHAGELVLWASFMKKGRPLPLKDEGMPSWIDEELDEYDFDVAVPASRPGNVHSKKPEEVQDRIERLLHGPYLEIFARRQRPGWECFGNEVNTENRILSPNRIAQPIRADIQQLRQQAHGVMEPVTSAFMEFKPITEKEILTSITVPSDMIQKPESNLKCTCTQSSYPCDYCAVRGKQ